jgi:hypothetical protein
MPFENTERIIAVAAENVATLFPALLEQFGEDLSDHGQAILTIGGHWDDTAKTRKRAAKFPTTITGTELTDGRMAFIALWQSDLAAAYDDGQLPDAEQLTPEQFQALIPPPTEDL